MTERTRNVIVGVTAIIGFAGLALLTTLFGYAAELFEKSYPVKIAFADSGGLTVGSRATYSGIDVGRVDMVELVPPPKQGVVVRVMVREEISLPETVQATVASPLLGGSPKVAFVYEPASDTEASLAMLAKDGSAELEGTTRSMMGRLTGEMKTALEGTVDRLVNELQEPKQQLAELQAGLVTLSEEWTEVGQNVNALVEMRDPADVDAGDAQANLATMVQRTDARLAELQQTIDYLNTWIGDEAMRVDVKQTAANTRELSGRLNESSKELAKVINASGENIDNLTKRYVALADDLSKTVDGLNKTLEQARDGKGTVGKLLNDPELYDNLNNDAERLGAALDDLRLLIQQWREEGVPIKLFD